MQEKCDGPDVQENVYQIWWSWAIMSEFCIWKKAQVQVRPLWKGNMSLEIWKNTNDTSMDHRDTSASKVHTLLSTGNPI